MSICVELVDFQNLASWIETTVSGLPYELGVNGAKKVNGNWSIINKNGHSTFHTVNMRVSPKKTVMVIKMIPIGHVLEASGPY